MIRQATIEDRVDIVRMATRFILESHYNTFLAGWTATSVAHFVDKVLEHGVIFVCERVTIATEPRWQQGAPAPGGELVGMLALVVVEHPLSGRSFAEEIAWWVDPEHRKSSVGPRLLRHMEHWCAEKALHMVKMVAPTGSSVGDFYGKHGYQALESHWVKVLS